MLNIVYVKVKEKDRKFVCGFLGKKDALRRKINISPNNCG
jgi:hypothetical protein